MQKHAKYICQVYANLLIMIILQHITSKTCFYHVSLKPFASETNFLYGRVRFERGNEFHPKRSADASYEKSVMQFTFEVDFLKTMKNQLAGSCTRGFNIY